MGLPERPFRTLPGRKPSEIPSKTQSVSAFLPGRVSVCPRSSGNSAHGRMAPLQLCAVTRSSVIRTQAPAVPWRFGRREKAGLEVASYKVRKVDLDYFGDEE